MVRGQERGDHTFLAFCRAKLITNGTAVYVPAIRCLLVPALTGETLYWSHRHESLHEEVSKQLATLKAFQCCRC